MSGLTPRLKLFCLFIFLKCILNTSITQYNDLDRRRNPFRRRCRNNRRHRPQCRHLHRSSRIASSAKTYKKTNLDFISEIIPKEQQL